MNSKEIGLLNALAKRRDWLSDRIAKRKAEGGPLSFDKQEKAALSWAIGIIAEHFDKKDRQTAAEAALLNRCTKEERQILLNGGTLRENAIEKGEK